MSRSSSPQKRSSSPPKRSVSPQRSKSPPKRSSSQQYQEVQSRYLDPNPRYTPDHSNNNNPRFLSPFFSRLTHSKNRNPWVPNKNLSYVGSGDKGSSPESNTDTNTRTSITSSSTYRSYPKYNNTPKHYKYHLKGSIVK